jgi:serine/threonine protein kinase
MDVAIKTLHQEHVEANRDEFLREAKVMIGLNHHCIVRLIGVSKGPPLLMVSVQTKIFLLESAIYDLSSRDPQL